MHNIFYKQTGPGRGKKKFFHLTIYKMMPLAERNTGFKILQNIRSRFISIYVIDIYVIDNSIKLSPAHKKKKTGVNMQIRVY